MGPTNGDENWTGQLHFVIQSPSNSQRHVFAYESKNIVLCLLFSQTRTMMGGALQFPLVEKNTGSLSSNVRIGDKARKDQKYLSWTSWYRLLRCDTVPSEAKSYNVYAFQTGFQNCGFDRELGVSQRIRIGQHLTSGPRQSLSLYKVLCEPLQNHVQASSLLAAFDRLTSLHFWFKKEGLRSWGISWHTLCTKETRLWRTLLQNHVFEKYDASEELNISSGAWCKYLCFSCRVVAKNSFKHCWGLQRSGSGCALHVRIVRLSKKHSVVAVHGLTKPFWHAPWPC